MSDILDLEIRKKIYDLILKDPGLHARKIAYNLNVRPQLVDYHLRYLERHGIIVIEHEKGYSRIYIKGEVGSEDKQLISILRQEIALKIVVFLLNHPCSKHKEIVKELKVSSPHVSYYLRKLANKDIVEISTLDGKKGYVLKDKKRIIEFLIKYRPTSLVDNIKDIWDDFSPE